SSMYRFHAPPPTLHPPLSLHDALPICENARPELGTESELAPPSHWHEVDVRTERHDDEEVIVTRWQPTKERRLEGPHVSVVRGRDGRVVGYTALDLDANNDPRDLPDAERAR